MKFKIFCVYDSKAEAYMQPFLMPTKGQAIRAFQTTVNDPSTDFNKYPGDFTLFEIGEWDDQTSKIGSYDTKVNLGTALEHKSYSEKIPWKGELPPEHTIERLSEKYEFNKE